MVRVPLSSKAPNSLYIYQKLKKLCNNSFKLSIFMDLDSDLPDSVWISSSNLRRLVIGLVRRYLLSPYTLVCS